MKNKINEIKKLFDDQISSNRVLSEKEEKIAENAGQYTAEYRAEIKRSITAEHLKEATARRDNILQKIKELRDIEKVNIDLSDTALNNAITYIAAVGNKLDITTAKNIVNSFRGNQAALKLLKSVFERAGLETHLFKSITYDVADTYSTMYQAVYSSFKQPQYISKMSSVLAVLSNIESVCEPIEEKLPELKYNNIPTMI